VSRVSGCDPCCEPGLRSPLVSRYGIGKAADAHPDGLAAWKGQVLRGFGVTLHLKAHAVAYSIAFFLGGFTILLSVVVYFTLGVSNELRWLSQEDKATIKDCLDAEKLQGQERHRTWDRDEAIRALKDPQTHFFWLATMLSAMPSTVITTFGRG